MQHLNQLLERLIVAEVECVLIGGFAAIAHGSSLQTRDVDVCIRLSEVNSNLNCFPGRCGRFPQDRRDPEACPFRGKTFWGHIE